LARHVQKIGRSAKESLGAGGESRVDRFFELGIPAVLDGVIRHSLTG
jgi:hypothetical protein